MRKDPDCLFCKIIDGAIPATVLHRDEQVVVIADINPCAPFHALIIPLEHIPTLNNLEPAHAGLVAHIFHVAKKLMAEHGYAEQGYRVVVNCGAYGGQSVYHLHYHVLAGRALGWPPG
jgi:histidine triad (HIT) family protein